MAATPPSEGKAKSTPGPLTLIAVVIGLAVAVCLMLLAFAAPMVNSGPNDLPIAVSGPDDAVAALSAALEEKNPGAFEVQTYSGKEDFASAIINRDAVGGISIGADGTVTVQTASAAGRPYSSLLSGIGSGLAANGQDVSYTDLAPLTENDPSGSAINALSLPLTFGGMASAVGLVTVFRRSRKLRVVGSIAFSIVAGIAATAILQYMMGAIDGSFWATAVGVSLGIAAISLIVLGLESLIGYAGLGIGAVTMLFISNPLSGIATGPDWLPHPWGEIGQFLPVGAAGSVVRSAAFFGGGGRAGRSSY